jgi:hypothetical protein
VTNTDLNPREVSLEVRPNAAGIVIVKATHLPTGRFATAAHRDRKTAIREAQRELAQRVARMAKRRKE